VAANFPAIALSDKLVTLLRFCLVGGFATLVFIGLSWLLLWLELLPATIINVVALAVSLGVSYVGHYYFTYRKSRGMHAFFGLRFFVVTTVLGLASALFTHVAIENFRISPYIVSMLVSVLYPVLSLLLHHFWTFAEAN